MKNCENDFYDNIAPLWDGEKGSIDINELTPNEIKWFQNLKRMEIITMYQANLTTWGKKYWIKITKHWGEAYGTWYLRRNIDKILLTQLENFSSAMGWEEWYASKYIVRPPKQNAEIAPAEEILKGVTNWRDQLIDALTDNLSRKLMWNEDIDATLYFPNKR